MGLGERLALAFRGRIRPAWSFRAGGVIWRLMPSRNGFLAGEERDLDAKRVSFFSLDARSGLVHWKGLSVEEPWWTGLEALAGGAAYIHGFASPDMPGHRGIHAVDLATGKVLWRSERLTFVAADGSSVYAAAESGAAAEAEAGRHFIELDAATGSPGRTLDRLPDLPQNEYDFVTYPRPAGGGGELPDVAAALRRHAGRGEAIGAECIVTERAAVVSSYRAIGGGNVAQTLSVSARPSGALLYRDQPAGEAPAPVPDSFFALGDLLYYVREKRTLVALPLPGGAMP